MPDVLISALVQAPVAGGSLDPLTIPKFVEPLVIPPVMPPVEKVLFTGRLIHCEVFDPEKGFEFTLVYRDRGKIPYAKRVKVEKFIRNKEYELIKGKAGKVDLLPLQIQ